MSTIHDFFSGQQPTWSQITQTITDTIRDKAQSAEDVSAFISELGNQDWRAILELRDTRRRIENAERANRPERCHGCGLLFPVSNLYNVRLTESNRHLDIASINQYCIDCATEAVAKRTPTCQACGETFLRVKGRSAVFCPSCASDDVARESRRVRSQLTRARLAGVEASLTVSEWLGAIKHFGGMCAYCGKEPFDVLEHYIPISHGGGTTANNCVPACYSCNSTKNNRHPDTIQYPLDFRLYRASKYLEGLQRDATISSTDRS